MPSPASLSNLRPYKPGQTGNTYGRPRAYHIVLRLARANSPDAVRMLVACMNDSEAPWPARIHAASLILDRAWGKPKEHLELDGDGITSLTVRFVDPDGKEIDFDHRGDGDGRVVDADTFEISLNEAMPGVTPGPAFSPDRPTTGEGFARWQV